MSAIEITISGNELVKQMRNALLAKARTVPGGVKSLTWRMTKAAHDKIVAEGGLDAEISAAAVLDKLFAVEVTIDNSLTHAVEMGVDGKRLHHTYWSIDGDGAERFHKAGQK